MGGKRFMKANVNVQAKNLEQMTIKKKKAMEKEMSIMMSTVRITLESEAMFLGSKK